MTRVAGLHRLTLRAPNLERLGAFYRDVWGMRLAHRDHRRWLLQSRASPFADLCIEASADAAAGLVSLGLRVNREQNLAPLLADAAKAGGRITRPPSASSEHAGEFGASLDDPDGNRIELTVQGDQAPGPAPAGIGPQLTGPLRIGHVVLWTPRIEAMEAFYSQLGLHVTDRTAMGMSFLRCNPDHHSVALVRHKEKTGLQHVAFDVGSIDAVMCEKGRLTAAGLECVWGPGRHGPGNNVFSYYRDPAGNIIELYGDMQQISDAAVPAEPVYWGPEHRGDIWGVAGPAPQAFRS